jgi:hypothetical protein
VLNISLDAYHHDRLSPRLHAPVLADIRSLALQSLLILLGVFAVPNAAAAADPRPSIRCPPTGRSSAA